jgi:hypothetical protein
MRDMDNLDWIWTVPIDVNNKSESFTTATRLRLPSGQIMRLDPYAVEASIYIRPLEPAGETEGNLKNETAPARRTGTAAQEKP